MSIREQPQAESSSDPLPARCPRCHYDLRGIVDAWADACPLAGCCSECGLNLLWRDVLNPVFTLPRWFVESDQGLRWWGHRLIATAICTLNPWRFWRRIQMSHPSRPGRLAMFLLTLVGLVYLLGTMSIG